MNPQKVIPAKNLLLQIQGSYIHIAADVQSQTIILLASGYIAGYVAPSIAYTATSQGPFIDRHQSCSHADNHELSKLWYSSKQQAKVAPLHDNAQVVC